MSNPPQNHVVCDRSKEAKLLRRIEKQLLWRIGRPPCKDISVAVVETRGNTYRLPVLSVPFGAMLEIVNSCPLMRPSRLSFERMSTLSPGETSISREQVKSNESVRHKSSVISFLEGRATTLSFSQRAPRKRFEYAQGKGHDLSRFKALPNPRFCLLVGRSDSRTVSRVPLAGARGAMICRTAYEFARPMKRGGGRNRRLCRRAFACPKREEA